MQDSQTITAPPPLQCQTHQHRDIEEPKHSPCKLSSINLHRCKQSFIYASSQSASWSRPL